MKRLTKYAILILLAALFLVSAASCTYYPPEGYTKTHHTYEEILAFAQSIDPNATVSKTYTDTQIDDLNRNFREWDAVINGVECHVSSVGDFVWNSGFMGGEFSRQYYVIDTDYDYIVLQKILSEKQPEWEMTYTDIAGRYNWNDILCVNTSYTEKRQLSDTELETAWAEAYDIYLEYTSHPIRKQVHFKITTPSQCWNQIEDTYFISYDYPISMSDFSEQGKTEFFQKYASHWDLLHSGLPIKE
jgi:hypothetical protein